MKPVRELYCILRHGSRTDYKAHNLDNMWLGALFVLLLGVFSFTRAHTSTRVVYAATPSTLNFQARIYNASGSTVADGSYSVEFKLYTAASGGTNEWTETQAGLTVKNGYFSVQLGSVTPFSNTIDWSQEKWLTLNVNADGEMSPRIKLTGVPYSFRSGQADTLTNGSSTLTADNLTQLAPSSVQAVNSALAALRLNQTGVGLLAQWQGDGSDVFTVSKTGGITTAGSIDINGPTLDVGSAIQSGALVLHEGDGDTLTLQTGSQSGNLVFTLPSTLGANGDCLKGNGSGILSFSGCGGANSFENGGNAFGSQAVLGTTDSNNLQIITANTQALLIDTSGNIRIGSSGSASEKLDVNGAIRLGTTTNANAGTIRWTGTDFEGYDGLEWKSLTSSGGGGGNLNASVNFISGLANVGGNLTGAVAEMLVFTTATGVSNTAGVTGFTAPADGSFRTCLIKNTSAVTAGTLSLRWQVNGASVGSSACNMDATTNRQSATALDPGVVTFSAGDSIGVAFDTSGMTPTNNDFTVYWSIEYNSSASGGGASSLQDAYDLSGTPATITTDNAKDLKVTLANTATDASFLVDIASGSTGRFAVQDNGIDAFSVTSSTISLAKAIVAGGGLNLTSSGITNAGSITGVGANITASAGLTVASGAGSNLSLDSASGVIVLGASTLRTVDSVSFDMQKATDTLFTLENSGSGISNLNLSDGGLQTASTTRLTNGGALQNITGLTVTNGGASITGNVTLGGSSADRLTFSGQVLGASPLVFQGVTDNGFATTLAVTDPTANHTITFPNATGTLVLDARSISAGTGLSGGGNLSADRTLSLDINGLTSTTAVNASDTLAIYDGSGIKKITRSDFLQGLTGALQYHGTWDASTNTPSLSDGTGAAGDEYVVSVGGNQDLGSGTINFIVGDFIIHNGTKWERAPSGSSVTSVFGRTGAITAQNGDYSGLQITNTAAGNISATTVQAALNELDSEKLGSLNGLTAISQTFANDTNITITSSGSTHTLGWDGLLAVGRGGTGAGSFTPNGVIYGNGTGALQVTGAGTTGQCLVATTGGAPAWGTCATGGGSGTTTLQQAYDNGQQIATTDARNILFTLADTSIDSNLLVNIATGSTSKFAIQNSGTDILSVNSTGTIIHSGGLSILAGGASISGGLNNNSGGIINAGNITGVGSTISSTTGLTISSGGSSDLIFNSASNRLLVDPTDTSLERISGGDFTINLSDVSATTLILDNADTGVADLNLNDGGLQTAGLTRLDNGGNLLNIGSISASGQLMLSGVATDITTGANEDLTLTANGSGLVFLNDTVQIGTLGAASNDAVVCYNGSSQIATCNSTFATTANAFLQNGNSFNAAAILGTNDDYGLSFKTNNTTRVAITNAGNITITGGTTGDALTVSNSTSTGNIAVFTDGTTPTNVLTIADGGLITLQPSSSVNGSLNHIVQNMTIANTTASSTIRGSQQNLTINNSTNVATTILGTELNLTDNSTATNTNTGLKIVLGGTNTSNRQFGIDASVTRGVGLRVSSAAAPGISNQCISGTAWTSYGICANSTSTDGGVGVLGHSVGAASGLRGVSNSSGSGLVGINVAASPSASFLFGVRGVAAPTGVSGMTAYGVYGEAGVNTAASSASAYGGYFTLGTSQVTAGAALYASNFTNAANILQIQDNTTDVFVIADGGNITATGTYNTNTFTSSGLTFGAASSAALSSATGQALSVDSGTTGALNVGTGANAKTITFGNATGATQLNFNAGTGGINLNSAVTFGSTLSANGNLGITVGPCAANNYIGNGVRVDDGIITAGSCRADGLSDIRLKTNITELDDTALNSIRQILTISFDFKCDEAQYANSGMDCITGRQTGVVAQQLAEVLPDLVYQDENGYYNVKYQGLSIYTLKAVGELAEKVDAQIASSTPNEVKTDGILRLSGDGVLQNINGINMISGGASVVGGIDNNYGGIKEAGSITGATNIQAETMKLEANENDNLLELTKDSEGVFTVFNNGALELRLDANNAFAVKDKEGKDYFSINTEGGLVMIGSSGIDEQAVLLVLDKKSTPGDPVGVNGASYYNSALNKFRCYQNDRWQDCLPAATAEYVLVSQQTSWPQPTGENEFIGLPRSWIELSNAQDYRLLIQVNEPGAPFASCRLQYTTDEKGAWKDLAQPGGYLSINETGSHKTAWTAITPDARKEILVRVMCKDGDYSSSTKSGTTPVFSSIRIQVK